MAFVLLKSGRPVTMTAEKAMHWQAIINGTVTASVAEKAKAAKIKKIYFAGQKRSEGRVYSSRNGYMPE